MPKSKPPSKNGRAAPKRKVGFISNNNHNLNPMAKVKIKRVKRIKKKVTAKEKILTGLGAGGVLMGGLSGMSAKPPQTKIVSRQSQEQAAAGSSIKDTLGKIFNKAYTSTIGPKVAKADTWSVNPDWQPDGSYGGYWQSDQDPSWTSDNPESEDPNFGNTMDSPTQTGGNGESGGGSGTSAGSGTGSGEGTGTGADVNGSGPSTPSTATGSLTAPSLSPITASPNASYDMPYANYTDSDGSTGSVRGDGSVDPT
ncbi:MAG: hypothetical protein P4L74_03040, partial [Candidatus Doudnabacteria bacterium]|nr:hypothetical protein [Candidatus Doudnabacteria bacterium]